MKDIIKLDNSTKANISQLDSFAAKMNVEPLKDSIYINKMANNSKYLPISFIQMKLDEIFVGLWRTENFTTQVVANEIIGQIELSVFHPVAKVWITRIGAASVMIQQKKGAEITDINAKHKNTLVKDYPHLLAECMKSAAKTLGKLFGRDLNRQFNDEYTSFIDKAKELNESEEALTAINEATTRKELTAIASEHPEWLENELILDRFTGRVAQLKKQATLLTKKAAKNGTAK